MCSLPSAYYYLRDSTRVCCHWCVLCALHCVQCVYFGWTTVATVANITVLLVSLNWEGFGLADSVWTAIIVVVAMVIGTVTTLRNQDVAYGLVLIWAYFGILMRQTSAEGLDGRYPIVVAAVVASLLVFGSAEAVVLLRRRPTVAQ